MIMLINKRFCVRVYKGSPFQSPDDRGEDYVDQDEDDDTNATVDDVVEVEDDTKDFDYDNEDDDVIDVVEHANNANDDGYNVDDNCDNGEVKVLGGFKQRRELLRYFSNPILERNLILARIAFWKESYINTIKDQRIIHIIIMQILITDIIYK